MSERASRVVVTGGAGFIGSHVVDRLVGLGRQVLVVDNLITGKRANLAHHPAGAVELVVADVAEGLFAPLHGKGPVDAVIHLAAQVSVVASVANPLVDVHVNYRGTVQACEYARAIGAKKIVFASSAAIYGDVAELPVKEDAPPAPLSPYGIDKLASEYMLRYYSEVQGLPASAMRFFNVYGPRQDPSSPYSGVISIFAERAAAGRGLLIFGDGEQTRDFVFVGDVARIVVESALSGKGDRAICNVGTGRQITINKLAQTIVSLCGGKSEITHAEGRAGEILRSVAAVERAREVYGWRAEVELEDGLRRTLGTP